MGHYGLAGDHYGAGDYYQGDYYQGDIFSSIGKAVKGVAKLASNLPGPIGLAGKAVTKLTRTKSTKVRAVPAPPAGAQLPTPGLGGALARFLPGGSSGMTQVPGGYHINKAYMRYLRAQAMGGNVQDPTQQPRVTNLVVKNRKMNPLNPKAFRRGSRRVGAGVNILRAAIAGTGYTVKRSGLPRARKPRKR